MKYKTIILLITVSLFNLAFTNCITDIFQKTELTVEMPQNVKMSFSENGGMAPAWLKIEIFENQITVEDKKVNDKELTKWYAEISKEDKTNLYQLFYKNKFDLIENEKQEGIVYDAGSESIRIRARKTSKRVSYGMNSPLSSSNKAKFNNISKAIKLLKNKYEPSSQKLN